MAPLGVVRGRKFMEKPKTVLTFLCKFCGPEGDHYLYFPPTPSPDLPDSTLSHHREPTSHGEFSGQPPEPHLHVEKGDHTCRGSIRAKIKEGHNLGLSASAELLQSQVESSLLSLSAVPGLLFPCCM